MSEEKKETPKKRSTYKRAHTLEFPDWVDKTKSGYRWLNAERFGENSDGYDPRGYVPAKGPDGKMVRRGDLILGSMPIDEFEAMKETKNEINRRQMEMTLQKSEEEMAREGHEFRKKGGKIKFSFEQN